MERLAVEFVWEDSRVEETPGTGESPMALAERLAVAKASAVGTHHPDAWIIGSDQVAALDDEIIGKPGSHEKAVEQLTRFSGKTLEFFTAVCLTNLATGQQSTTVDKTVVQFRDLSGSEIETYLARERPYNCAGSFKSEGLGIALFEYIENRDPTALMGLPLIWLSQALRDAGFQLV